MYTTSETMALNKLDGKELLKYGLDVDDPKFRDEIDKLVVRLSVKMGKESGCVDQDYDYED